MTTSTSTTDPAPASEPRSDADRFGDVVGHVDAALAASCDEYGDELVGSVIWALCVEWQRRIDELAPEHHDHAPLSAYVAELRELGRKIGTAEAGTEWLPINVTSELVDKLSRIDGTLEWSAASVLRRLLDVRLLANPAPVLSDEQRAACAAWMAREWDRWSL